MTASTSATATGADAAPGDARRAAQGGSRRSIAVALVALVLLLVATCAIPPLAALLVVLHGGPELREAASRYAVVLAVAAVVVVALALRFAYRLGREVTRAIDALVEPALALGHGQPVAAMPSAFREIEAVARALDRSAATLGSAQHDAYHDPLTKLRNRTLFDEMAERQIAQAYRDGAQLAILAIDLDGFKAVNDVHGHAAGDFVLQQVAERMTGLVRGSDVVSRRGGDEFAVMLVDVDAVKTRQVADKLLTALSQPYPGVSPPVSASIGVARYPHDATTLVDLLERADEALYDAKYAGKRRVVGDF